MSGNSVSSTINTTQLKETSNYLFKLLTSVGIVVMFAVGTIIGIQFMMASAEEKAKVKEALIPYVIGCAVIFGAFTIWSIAVNIGQDITSDSSSASKADSVVSRPVCSNCNNPQPEGYVKDKCLYCGHSM